jgi:lipopolysaccharide biosynthesis glycosyltransferase
MASIVWRKTLNAELKPLRIYVGWDSREDIAYQVAKFSIELKSSVPVEIIPLKQKQLKKQGLYWREADKLASTEFTFTRFLIPQLNDFNGWALFIDCDFVFLDDVKKLFDQADNRYAVMCAQHDYTPKSSVKMDGQVQTTYPRKNWSSMMLFNCGHPSNKALDKEVVNSSRRQGSFFHRLSWLTDKEIGKISHEWNWLVGWYKEPADGTPKALHYTEGGPWFKEYENCEYANEYYKVERQYLKSQIINKNKVVNINDLPLTDQKKKLIEFILKNIIDPNEKFYKNTSAFIKSIAEKEMGNKVAAIDSTGGINYQKKNLEYDSYLTSFILGSGGTISDWNSEKETNSALVIRGLGGGSQNAIKHCWETGRNFYAIDTGYFGNQKSKFWHRVTKNNLQHLGPIVERPADRLKQLEYHYVPFTPGRKILICPPSEKVMNLWNQSDPTTWTDQVIKELKEYTDRPIEIRLKPLRSERITNKTIEAALANDVYCLITYNSIAATEALLNGKPSIALGPNAAQVLCNTKLSEIENLYYPSKDEIYAFACHLSYAQFNQSELQDGTAWRIVNNESS